MDDRLFSIIFITTLHISLLIPTNKCGPSDYNGWVTGSASLPRASYNMAVSYSEETNTILLLGGEHNFPSISSQLVEYHISSNTFVDINSSRFNEYIGGDGQYYAQQPPKLSDFLYMIGSDLVMGFSSYDRVMDFDSYPSIPINVGHGGCICILEIDMGYLVVNGGGSGSNAIDTVQILNISNNEWMPNIASLNTPRMSHTCNAFESTVFSIGGYDGSTIDTVEVYNFYDNDSGWQYTTDNLPTSMMCARSVVYHNEIVIFGGYSDSMSSLLNSVTVINAITYEIYAVSSYTDISFQQTAAIIVEDTIYLFGGWADDGAMSSMQYLQLNIKPTHDQYEGCYPTNVCYASPGAYNIYNAIGYKYICDNNGDIWIETYNDLECSILAASALADMNNYEVQMVQCDRCTDYVHGRQYDDNAIATCDYDADFSEILAPLGCNQDEDGDGSESVYVECDADSVSVYKYDTNSVCDGVPDTSMVYKVGCGVNGIYEVNGTVSEILMFGEGFHCGSISYPSNSTTFEGKNIEIPVIIDVEPKSAGCYTMIIIIAIIMVSYLIFIIIFIFLTTKPSISTDKSIAKNLETYQIDNDKVVKNSLSDELIDILHQNNLYNDLYDTLKEHCISLETIKHDITEDDKDDICQDIGLKGIKKVKFKTLCRIIHGEHSNTLETTAVTVTKTGNSENEQEHDNKVENDKNDKNIENMALETTVVTVTKTGNSENEQEHDNKVENDKNDKNIENMALGDNINKNIDKDIAKKQKIFGVLHILSAIIPPIFYSKFTNTVFLGILIILFGGCQILFQFVRHYVSSKNGKQLKIKSSILFVVIGNSLFNISQGCAIIAGVNYDYSNSVILVISSWFAFLGEDVFSIILTVFLQLNEKLYGIGAKVMYFFGFVQIISNSYIYGSYLQSTANINMDLHLFCDLSIEFAAMALTVQLLYFIAGIIVFFRVKDPNENTESAETMDPPEIEIATI